MSLQGAEFASHWAAQHVRILPDDDATAIEILLFELSCAAIAADVATAEMEAELGPLEAFLSKAYFEAKSASGH